MQRRCTTLICNARVGHDQVGQGSKIMLDILLSKVSYTHSGKVFYFILVYFYNRFLSFEFALSDFDKTKNHLEIFSAKTQTGPGSYHHLPSWSCILHLYTRFLFSTVQLSRTHYYFDL